MNCWWFVLLIVIFFIIDFFVKLVNRVLVCICILIYLRNDGEELKKKIFYILFNNFIWEGGRYIL